MEAVRLYARPRSTIAVRLERVFTERRLEPSHRLLTMPERANQSGSAQPTALARLPFPSVDTTAVVETYVRAWHERDEAARRRLLEQSWTEGGVYTDPTTTIKGRDALVEAIADFHERRPEVRIEVRSPIDEFDRHFRFVWATVDSSGVVLREGIDVGQLDTDGRIVSIIGFFGVVP